MRSAGYVGLAFATAEEFLAQPIERFDCILTDIHMPGLSGLELLQALKTHHAGAAVIIMTADPDKGWREQAFAGGAEGFLEKPFDAAVLLKLIARSLGLAGSRS